MMQWIKTATIVGISFFSTILLADSPNTLSADAGYIKVPHPSFGENHVNPIRLAALQEAASTLGTRGGLAWQARNINLALQQEVIFLDQVFDFNQLLLDHNVLPPVLAESNGELNLDDDSTLRTAQQTYRILAPARFVTTPPNWREYLWMRFERPALPDHSLLPQTQAETEVWDHYLKEGWEKGIQQANDIFTANLNRLKTNIVGMVLYRKLLALHMVSAPFVAEAQLGVTGDATQLRINDQVLRITAQSQLQPNPQKWQPILTK
ncbi:MAG: type IV secretion system protein DotC [Gammaproteobacteria bacterium RIFCSPHIGHO2_12_FULL_45_9]|nr:MAG: type IV secretion system protein DotC [Gammaproteobacteria bacterium RIFCSPHIGHO2_12_FULL_45_9]